MAESIVSVKVDAHQAYQNLKGIERKKFPYVYALSLTRTAQTGAEAGRIRTRRAFKLKSDFIPKNLRIKAALKSDFKRYGFARSHIFTGNKLNGWMPLHEYNGVKKPHATGGNDKGQAIAIPGKGLEQYSYKTSTGRVRKRWKPKTLLKGYDGNSSRRKRPGKGSIRKPFITTAESGVGLIVRRRSKRKVKKGESSLEVLYVLVDSAQIEDNWMLTETVAKIAPVAFRQWFNYNWAKELNKP